MKELNPQAFGQRVRERRKELGWGQEKLAAESGYSQTNIYAIEKGTMKDPRKQAIRLAEALRSSPDWLLHGAGQRETGPHVLTVEQFLAIYDDLPVEGKAALTSVAEKYRTKKKRA